MERLNKIWAVILCWFCFAIWRRCDKFTLLICRRRYWQREAGFVCRSFYMCCIGLQ